MGRVKIISILIFGHHDSIYTIPIFSYMSKLAHEYKKK